MTVVLVVVAIAVLAGVARGGSLAQLGELHLPGWPLVILGLLVQVVGAFAGDPTLYVVGMLASAVCVTAFVARNRHLPGMPLIAGGFLLNAIVVTANGAMPVDPRAAARAGVSIGHLSDGLDAKHEIRDDDTALPLLSDIIAVPIPGGHGSNVLSVGDVVLAAGIGILVLNSTIAPAPTTRPGLHQR